ncbi:MAG TPA: hypothetical protein DIC34_01290 [Treponema sp.]|nr:hypothetical protein [Treponema sp.]
MAIFDTAGRYSRGGSERRLGELVAGEEIVIGSKFPPALFASPWCSKGVSNNSGESLVP